MILSMDRNSLEDPKGADVGENYLALDAWEESETINISRHSVHK